MIWILTMPLALFILLLILVLIFQLPRQLACLCLAHLVAFSGNILSFHHLILHVLISTQVMVPFIK